jgi:hypothetical protein
VPLGAGAASDWLGAGVASGEFAGVADASDGLLPEQPAMANIIAAASTKDRILTCFTLSHLLFFIPSNRQEYYNIEYIIINIFCKHAVDAFIKFFYLLTLFFKHFAHTYLIRHKKYASYHNYFII